MDRRFLTVLGVSLVFALVVSSIFYQMSARAGGGSKKPESDSLVDVVVAAKPLSVGVSVKPDDIKVMKIPAAGFPKGAFGKVEEVIDRPVVSNILLDEPVLDGRLAARGAGMGLAPVIPVGMRAVSVRVNEVVGVAGFVLPFMHVDVLVTGRPPGDATFSMTTTVLQDITVLSAGQTIQPDARGQAINAPVVTLLVTPEQAEVLTLAGTETKIQLVLRNSSDKSITTTTGQKLLSLYKGVKDSPKPVPGDDEARPARRARPRPVETAQSFTPAPPPVAPPPIPDQIVVIRGTQKTVEVVNNPRQNGVGRN
ncbi:MAG: Flp pilus assembly protein CpaB [Bryobacterales bacterium]|nr:Flp pilus assembly protein CpaB [Bryobacterales bacterium]